MLDLIYNPAACIGSASLGSLGLKEAVIYIAIIFFYSIKNDTTKA